MTTELERMIDEYVSCVRACVSILQEHFGSTNLLIDSREGRIPKRGKIADVTFMFHGVGCTIDTASSSVNFDFGPDGAVGGFDAYRLSRFAKSLPPSHDSAPTEDDFQRCLARLQQQGKVIAPRLDPSPYLLYFASECSHNEDADV